MRVSTPKHGWAPEMRCPRLVGLHPPRGDLTCKWVAEVKGPPREGSLHFEPWQQGSCPLCLLPSVPCARSDVQITGLWINTFRSYGKWTGCHWPTWLPVGAPGTCCGSSGSGTISDGRAVPRHGTMPIVEATRPGQAVAVAGNPTDPWPVLGGSPAARECRWSRPPPTSGFRQELVSWVGHS